MDERLVDGLGNTPVNLDNSSKSYASMPFNGSKIDLHAWAKGAYYRDVSLQAESRMQRAIDADFYHDKQFTESEKEDYENDGRLPPLQYNSIKQAVNWIIGSYLRQTYDWQILPRTEDDVEPAIRKTKLTKYISDINSASRQDSLAFNDALITGEGWIEVGYETNDDGVQQIVVRHEHWRNIILDSSCRRLDASDATRLHRSKILDIEQLVTMFPEHKAALQAEAKDREQVENDYLYQTYNQSGLFQGGSMFMSKAMPYDGTREAIRVTETWYKYPMLVKMLRGTGKCAGYVFDPENQEHLIALQMGDVEVVQTRRQQMNVCIYTDSTLLFSGVSPHKHNRFPFVRTVAYLDDKTGMPYGVIRALRDPQMSMNVRRNKALHLLSTKRVVMDEGAVDDISQLEEEMARPDSIIVVKPNKKFEVIESPALAESHIRFSQEDDAYIRQASGVTGENLGLPSNATSGIAIQARQEQGSVSTLFVFENAAWAFEKKGQLVLSMIEQYIDKKMQFRLTSDNNSQKDFVSINDGTPETDITNSQSDFIVNKQNYHATIRQALAESLLPLASTIASATGNPMAAFAVIDTAVSLTDIPNKEGIMSKLRNALGLPNPDESDEEKAQREQAQAAEQQKQAALTERKVNAEISKIEADVRKANAEADNSLIEAIDKKLTAITNALAASKQVTPEGSAVADDLIANADNILNIPNQQPQPMPVEQPQADFANSGDIQQ